MHVFALFFWLSQSPSSLSIAYSTVDLSGYYAQNSSLPAAMSSPTSVNVGNDGNPDDDPRVITNDTEESSVNPGYNPDLYHIFTCAQGNAVDDLFAAMITKRNGFELKATVTKEMHRAAILAIASSTLEMF